jgi:hypothetical protein
MTFWQTHDCSGYRAKVTIEWSAPENIELLPERAEDAEAIADDIMAKLAPGPLEIVRAMMGRSR